MYRLVGILGSLALICSACTKPAAPKSVSQAAFFRLTDYQTWTCAQLLNEAVLLTDALAIATEHQPDANTSERIAHIKRSKEAVRQELAAKSCRT
jgi:hypothetical protein